MTNAFEDVAFLSNKIAGAAMKGKFVDFNDALVPADVKDYANLHGIGGKDHAPISGIRITITDYSQGTGDASKSVSAHAPREIFGEMLAICLRNAGTDHMSGVVKSIARNQKRQNAILQQIANICRTNIGVLMGKIDSQDNAVQTWFDELKETLKKCFKSREDNELPSNWTDYTYHQDRVNVYQNINGFVPVKTLDITRRNLREKDGNTDVSKNPWTISISSFLAKPKEHANGTVSYISSTIKDRTDAFIYLSDNDMYRCCYNVEHYIKIWEMAVCIPIVRLGLQEQEARRIERMTEREANRNAS